MVGWGVQLRILDFGRQRSGLISGLRSVALDPNYALTEIRGDHPSLTVQALDSSYVAGPKHLELILMQSLTAREKNVLYADKQEIDLLARVACDRQFSRALEKVGLRKGIRGIALVALGERSELERLSLTLSELGEPDDDLLELTSEKRRFLTRFHKISQKQLEATRVETDPFPYVLAEKAALLGVK